MRGAGPAASADAARTAARHGAAAASRSRATPAPARSSPTATNGHGLHWSVHDVESAVVVQTVPGPAAVEPGDVQRCGRQPDEEARHARRAQGGHRRAPPPRAPRPGPAGRARWWPGPRRRTPRAHPRRPRPRRPRRRRPADAHDPIMQGNPWPRLPAPTTRQRGDRIRSPLVVRLRGAPPRSGGLVPGQPLRFLTSAVACGSTVNRSPTTPKSTSSKIGASSSLLTATIVLEVCMPARCWMAPEMPAAT